MEPETQQSVLIRRLSTLFIVVFALLLVAICYGGFYLLRNQQTIQPVQPQLVQPEIPLPKSIPPSAEPDIIFLPVVVNSTAPTATTVAISTSWRFISINENDVGIFENVSDPSRRLTAKCIDPKRPPPDKGELYTLDGAGILRLQNESKKFQRFKLISRN